MPHNCHLQPPKIESIESDMQKIQPTMEKAFKQIQYLKTTNSNNQEILQPINKNFYKRPQLHHKYNL
jgi:hypothetical protein